MVDPRLNGFCTELPETNFPVKEKEKEMEMDLDIPYFLTPEWQAKERRKAEERAARRAAIRAAEHRKLRKKQQANREIWRGAFASVSIFAFVVFAVNIVEMLA